MSQHCIGCFPRIEQGVAPACVRQCPGRAAFIGFDDRGEPVRIVAAGPIGGDPLLVQVGFTRFALRHGEASRVMVDTATS